MQCIVMSFIGDGWPLFGFMSGHVDANAIYHVVMYTEKQPVDSY